MFSRPPKSNGFDLGVVEFQFGGRDVAYLFRVDLDGRTLPKPNFHFLANGANNTVKDATVVHENEGAIVWLRSVDGVKKRQADHENAEKQS